jgi:hypothetical protein
MSMKSSEYEYLTRDGKFPDDLDWDMEIETTEHEQTGRVTIKEVDWEFALFLGGPDILPMLVEDDTYYQEIDGHLPVGYKFDFRLDPSGNITARGNMYPAQITPGHSAAFTSEKPLVSADMLLKPRAPRTRGAIREYMELVSNTGGGIPAGDGAPQG